MRLHKMVSGVKKEGCAGLAHLKGRSRKREVLAW